MPGYTIKRNSITSEKLTAGDFMEFAKNCNECKNRFDCKSWYGGSSCIVKDKITQILKEENKKKTSHGCGRSFADYKQLKEV